MMKTQQAFTLIELMIAVAIIGILASIAIPNYQNSIRKARRADAKGALVSLANAMERHFTETSSYCDAAKATSESVNSCYPGEPSAADTGIDDTGSPSIYSDHSPIDGTTIFYNLKIDKVTANTYTLTAIPVNAQINDECGVLTLEQTGKRDIVVDSASSMTANDCW
jgi:type IV pilus assembly protein PilE